MCAAGPGEAGFAPAEFAGAPSGKRPADRARKSGQQSDACDGGTGFQPVDPAERRKRRVVKADPHAEAEDEPGQPQHRLRMSKGQDRKASRKDHVRDGEHLAATDGVYRTAGTRPHQRRDDERGREGSEEPRARHPEILGNAVTQDCREIEARCPA